MLVNAQQQVMNRSELPQIPTKWAVLVDLDGTIADHEARLKLLPKPDGDWEPFYRNQINDPTFEGVAELVRRLQDLFIVIVTARPEKYREESQQWLVNNRIPYDAVLMRAEGDHRPNEEVKQDMLDQVYALGWIQALSRCSGMRVLRPSP
jgi:uncharacterized HAD superfamily protein